jgi:selenocysteine lyase/cysteine desulfurase
MDALDLMGTNRISTAPYTTEEDIDRCLAAIAEAARKLL